MKKLAKSKIMKINSIIRLLFISLTSLLLLFQESQAQSRSTAIKDVTIIDVTDGSLHPAQIVLIKENRIVSIGKAIEIPENSITIEAQGKYLIPGLWDMHSHAIHNSEVQQLYLANGVTGLREMGGNFRQANIIDSLSNANQPVTRFLIGHLVNGAEMASDAVAKTPTEARRIVDSLVENNASFVKPYSSLKPEVFFALMNRAKELGLPAAGHVPDLVHTLKAAELEMRSLEHSALILKDCTPLAGTLVKEYLKIMDMEDSLSQKAIVKLMDRELSSFDENICREIAKELSALGTAVTPTLITMYKHWYRPLVNFHNDPNLKYMPKYLHNYFDPDFAPYSEKEWKVGQDMHPINKKLVRILNEEGVMLLAGSDTGIAVPGFGLHEELMLLVEAGLTPLEALQTATLNPAIYLDRLGELGTVETDKLADLVLLNANPLEDISNTSDVHAVIMNGVYLNSDKLNMMLQEVATAYAEE